MGVRVNDRVVRMAQEQAGRALRSASWRAGLTSGVLATWPADPRQRTAQHCGPAARIRNGAQRLDLVRVRPIRRCAPGRSLAAPRRRLPSGPA
ncbi:hypothetical protein FXF52_26195 [Micromonospora sp. MP36]|nr:hypothetical protein FXF52_26195 [Micromonospora sp. MP36]